MQFKYLKTREAIESNLGTTRLDRKKGIVKVIKSYPELSVQNQKSLSKSRVIVMEKG